jgi:RNA polymerase sigma factor (sigma-70 family)
MRRRHAGDDDLQFEDQFDGLYRRAYTVAYHVLLSREDAEDVAIEALARASSRWRAVRQQAIPWVTKVSTNLAVDELRRRRPQAELGEVAVPERDDVARVLDLRRSLRGLPRRQREAVVMRYLLGLSEAETAAALGCSVGAVKQHCSRALSKLRQEDGQGLLSPEGC